MTYKLTLPHSGPISEGYQHSRHGQEPPYDQTALKCVSTPQGPRPATSRRFGGDEAEVWEAALGTGPPIMTAAASSAGSSVAGRGEGIAAPPTLNLATHGQVTKPTEPRPPAGSGLGTAELCTDSPSGN